MRLRAKERESMEAAEGKGVEAKKQRERERKIERERGLHTQGNKGTRAPKSTRTRAVLSLEVGFIDAKTLELNVVVQEPSAEADGKWVGGRGWKSDVGSKCKGSHDKTRQDKSKTRQDQITTLPACTHALR
mmetsp:Transcript_51542/g.111946  ORF Transcript_51542/g.111946 Transcript_51542/m.111946 type:complete len:131 (-) Transcript_51542:36-428(-)